MVSIDDVMAQLTGLPRLDLERWIALRWVRPDGVPGHYEFQAIDIARIRLIREIRDEIGVTEDILPVVLSLLDQLYEQRRRMVELSEAIQRIASAELQSALAAHLAGQA